MKINFFVSSIIIYYMRYCTAQRPYFHCNRHCTNQNRNSLCTKITLQKVVTFLLFFHSEPMPKAFKTLVLYRHFLVSRRVLKMKIKCTKSKSCHFKKQNLLSTNLMFTHVFHLDSQITHLYQMQSYCTFCEFTNMLWQLQVSAEISTSYISTILI